MTKFEEEAYCAFDELTGLVEKGLSQASKIPSTTDKLSAEKLQEQLNTAKNALTDIIFFSQACYDSEYFASIAQKALAEIIGNDEK